MNFSDINLFFFYIWEVIKNWWWLPLPFVLWKPFKFLWLWWRIDRWLSRQRMTLLDIKIPKDSLKPIRAMESVMDSLHGAVYHPPDWWEKWIDGQIQLSISFEIASIGGETHFYVRTGANYRDSIESSIYSQYPDAEITEVDDYVKYVPQNIPNKDWGVFGSDYKLIREDYYPIKTYPKFETEHETFEEKRIDPVAVLLESMSKVKPGEQFWIQIVCNPIAKDPGAKPNTIKWLADAEEFRDKLSKRPGPSPGKKPIIQEATNVLVFGTTPEETSQQEKDIIPPEMRLTPGERDVVIGIEEKISKPVFETFIRFVYLGKKEVWFKPNFRLAFVYFNAYTTINLNALLPNGKTFTKIHKHWFLPVNTFIPRRTYLRCRKMFRNYIKRLPPYFPREGGTFKLNTEELASLFHFPSKGAAPAPGVSRIEAKRKGVPSDLPIE